MVIGDNPDLGVTLERTDVYASDSAGKVVIRIVNKGNTDIKFLNAKVIPNDNVKVIGADEVYVGKLDSDDFSTAEYDLYLKGKNSVKVAVEIAYKDSNNNEYKESREVEVKLYTNKEIKSFGIKKSNNIVWIAVALLAIGSAYFYIRRRRSRK